MSFNVHDNDDFDILKAINKAYKAGILATVTAGNKYQISQNQLCGLVPNTCQTAQVLQISNYSRYPTTICVAACDRYYEPWNEHDGVNGTGKLEAAFQSCLSRQYSPHCLTLFLAQIHAY
jgi:hypothetical protein